MAFDNGPGFTAYYGYAFYGQDVYGLFEEPVTTGIYLEQDGYCPRYLRFQFSGVNTLPLYVFDLNPSSYDSYPQRNTQSYKTILNYDPTSDEDYKKLEFTMSWDRMPETMWFSMLPYTRKKVDGTSELIYFWDGNIGHYKATSVRIESFRGEVRAGYDPVDRFNVSIKLREV